MGKEREVRANWRENSVVFVEKRKLSKRQPHYKNGQHKTKEFRWINKEQQITKPFTLFFPRGL